MVSILQLVKRGNDAINVNPPSPNVDIHLTTHGSDWLWAAFAVFTLLALVHSVVYAFTSSQTHSLRKSLFLIPLFTNAILAYTYFTYASNLGWASTPTEFTHVSTSAGLFVRQVFYVKYIGWFLAWPFALLAIEIATHNIEVKYDTTSELFTKLFNLFSSLITKVITTEIFVLGLLIGILIQSTYKWGYFVFAVTAQLFSMSLVAVSVAKSVSNTGTNKVATLLVLFQLLVWILYPICWGLSEGGNRIQPDSEAVFYGILDVITFGFVPTFLTWINASGLDEGFFNKVIHLKFNDEKVDIDSPRHSGDTAVPTQSPVAAPAENV